MEHPTIKFSLLFFILSGLLGSCYYDVEDELYPVSGADSCAVSTITYQSGIKQITDTRCAVSGCHVPGTARVDLSTYSGVKSIADDGRMRQRVLIDKSMPPGGPLDPCEMTKIKTWLDNGAPEN